MLWNVSIPFLIAGFVEYAFAGFHHYHAHSHRHRHLRRHAEQLELKDLAWDNAENIQGDMELEFVTLTTTTTVVGNCAPTKTIFSTLTLIKEVSEPTPCASEYPAHSFMPEPMASEPFQAQWNQVQPHSEPIYQAATQPEPANPHINKPQTIPPEPTESEATTTVLKTKTITRTATHTVQVTVTPEPDTPSLADTLRDNPTKEQKEVPHKGPPKKDNGGAVNAVLALPGEVLPDLPVVNQLLPGPKADKPAPVAWTATPPKGEFSANGFGGRTAPHGTEIHYRGNVGKPWGSNIIIVSPEEAHTYKYVAQFHGAHDKPWTVVVWNKFGPDGKMNGWYGHSAVTFSIAPGETRYVAFDEDSEGAWGAAPGGSLPKDQWGGYSCTWGEFTFGDGENNGWSGWDVSAIQAQIAKQHVQGMSICQADGKGCSVITPNADKVVDAYVESKKARNGIGGAAAPGPVRLDVLLDYRG